MRSAGGLLTILFALVTGCTTAPKADVELSRRQWAQIRQCFARPDAPSSTAGPIAEPAIQTPRRQFENIVSDAMSAVVQVRSRLNPQSDADIPTDGPSATSNRLGGTGAIISADGLILTNEHVVRKAKEITVTLSDGRKYKATKVAVAPRLDLAILRINQTGLASLDVSTSPVRAGEEVVAIAAARRKKPSCFRTGVVTSPAMSLQDALDPTRKRNYEKLIESTTYLEAGFSGGPLLDAEGQFVGLNVAASGHTDEYARGYAIPFDKKTQQVITRLTRQLTP